MAVLTECRLLPWMGVWPSRAKLGRRRCQIRAVVGFAIVAVAGLRSAMVPQTMLRLVVTECTTRLPTERGSAFAPGRC